MTTEERQYKYPIGTELYDSAKYQAETFRIIGITTEVGGPPGQLWYSFITTHPTGSGNQFKRTVKEIDAIETIKVVDVEARKSNDRMQKLIDGYRSLDAEDRIMFAHHALKDRSPSALLLVEAITKERGYVLK